MLITHKKPEPKEKEEEESEAVRHFEENKRKW